MGKGYNNFMSKKPFHPASKDNIKRVWMAEQRSIDEKKKEDEMRLQYEKEQDLYNNRLLVAGSDSKDKLSLNFMYEAPAGIKRPEKEIENPAEPEYKFEWQRNAPRESFAKNNMDIRDQPFGIQVRNVRCLKCHKWGHVNTDRECPFFNAGSLIEPQQQSEPAKPKGNDSSENPPPGKSDQTELIRNMKDEQGLALKKSLYGSYGAKRSDGDDSNQQMLSVKDPEVAFLASLTPRDKKKLLKKLQKLTNAQRGIKDDDKKVSKKKKTKKNKDKKKSKKDKKSDKRKYSDASSDSEEEHADEHRKVKKDRHTTRSAPSRSRSPSKKSRASRSDSPKDSGRSRHRSEKHNGRHSPSPVSRRHRSRSPVPHRRHSVTRSPPRGASNRSSNRHSPTHERKYRH